MADSDSGGDTLQPLFYRLAAGDEKAADDLIRDSVERLRRLARKKLRENPAIRRWEQTDDLLQNALVRLHKALKAVKPTSTRAFIGLAAEQIRRELIDLARHHYGPHGDGAHHVSDPAFGDSRPLDSSPDAARRKGEAKPAARPRKHERDGVLADLVSQEEQERKQQLQRDVDEKVASLPDAEREVFDCIHYLGMKQAEVAEKLEISVPTVKRRYRSARLLLHGATRPTEE